MVGVEAKAAGERARGIAHVDAGKTPGLENPEALLPHASKNCVHAGKRLRPPPRGEGVGYCRILLGERPVPHLYHGVGRRGDDEIYRLIVELAEILRRAGEHPVRRPKPEAGVPYQPVALRRFAIRLAAVVKRKAATRATSMLNTKPQGEFETVGATTDGT